MVNKRVVVIGAGVSGLSTATLLLQQEKEIKVHLVAKHFPEDLSGEYTSPWYVFRNLNKEELPTGIECGVTYKTDNLTLTINPSAYLNYLLNTFISLGGTTQHVSLSHLNECIESDTDVVINCSGIHAGTLGCVEDPEVYPARGQTVIVQLPQEYVNWAFFRHCAGSSNTWSDNMTYVIPRENGVVVLGGTFNEHNYSTDVDDNIAEAIIQRCLATRPDLLPPG
ncbi:hypothetical protein RhiirA1_451149 [Rhizophagus irregularis]|uniref:FAD dependent oxidoreductase domain-containing protein n=1 Tax=Rhizophagus irregularis TaxID=588596 RepID=A0A2N0SD08_9GLOM|nr:hypothetical protein RhiirA1_451149 [Rhizophagus irregularis]